MEMMIQSKPRQPTSPYSGSNMNFDCQQHTIIRLNVEDYWWFVLQFIGSYQIMDLHISWSDLLLHAHRRSCLSRHSEPTICEQLCVLVTQITMRGVLLPMVSSCCQFSINNFGHSEFPACVPHLQKVGARGEKINYDWLPIHTYN